MVSVIPIFDAQEVVKNTNVLSDEHKIENILPNTVFSFDMTVTGDGTAAVTFEIGDTADETFYAPASNSVLTNHTKITNTIGRDRIIITVPPTKFIKFRVEETDDANDIVVTGNLVIRD